MGSNKREYVKNLFQGIASTVLCKNYVSGNVKDDIKNEAKSNDFRTEIGLKVKL